MSTNAVSDNQVRNIKSKCGVDISTIEGFTHEEAKNYLLGMLVDETLNPEAVRVELLGRGAKDVRTPSKEDSYRKILDEALNAADAALAEVQDDSVDDVGLGVDYEILISPANHGLSQLLKKVVGGYSNDEGKGCLIPVRGPNAAKRYAFGSSLVKSFEKVVTGKSSISLIGAVPTSTEK